MKISISNISCLYKPFEILVNLVIYNLNINNLLITFKLILKLFLIASIQITCDHIATILVH